MNITVNQNLEFQKSKQKQIKYKGLSKFETKQEASSETGLQRASVSVGASVNSGGY